MTTTADAPPETPGPRDAAPLSARKGGPPSEVRVWAERIVCARKVAYGWDGGV